MLYEMHADEEPQQGGNRESKTESRKVGQASVCVQSEN